MNLPSTAKRRGAAKRLALCAVLLVCSVCDVCGFAQADGVRVVPSAQRVYVGGKLSPIRQYNIDGFNYVKLRDLALALSGTGSEFNVAWSGSGDSIEITLKQGEKYTPSGLEYMPLRSGVSCAPSGAALVVGGRRYTSGSGVAAYRIDGQNYFKLRDIASILGFRVEYDPDENRVML